MPAAMLIRQQGQGQNSIAPKMPATRPIAHTRGFMFKNQKPARTLATPAIREHTTPPMPSANWSFTGEKGRIGATGTGAGSGAPGGAGAPAGAGRRGIGTIVPASE